MFDFGGTLVETIPNVYGAGAMVVRGSTLYVVERNVGAVEAIDLATLTDSGPVGSGLAMPGWLAFAGGKLWTAVNGDYGWAQLATADAQYLGSSGSTTTTNPGGRPR